MRVVGRGGFGGDDDDDDFDEFSFGCKLGCIYRRMRGV